MSFAYKILNPSDITISPYTANKLYTFASSSLTEYGIVVYSGEYEPIINVSCSDGPAAGQVPCNPYDPETDITSNGYSRRLIYDSIQKLYYQSFISGGFSNVLWTSSSYDNYLQTALSSGSNYLTNVRIFGQDSGSGGSVYDGGIYDTGSYPSDPSLIRVISIPQDIFGSGIKPGTFEISSSNYLIQDDGQGNLMDNISITSSLYAGTDYISNVYGATPDRQGVHVGNIIYSHGMIIITNEDYFCFYPSEPVAQNNYFSILNVQATKLLPVLSNDFDDCAELDTGSLSVVTPLVGYDFPNNGPLNGYVNINASASNYHQVTPGLYKGTYFVSNSLGVASNHATISLEIYSSPLQLNVLSYTIGCNNTSVSQSVTYSINYGVPPYSWSLNETTSWDGISNLYQPTQSLSVAPTTNILYIKDAVGEIVSQSISNTDAPIIYVTSSTAIICAGGNGTITVTTASSDYYVSHSIDNSVWHTTYPYSYTEPAGNYYLYFKNNNNCSTTSSVISLVAPQAITASLTLLQGDCTDPAVGNVGALSASVTGGVLPYSYTWYFNGSPLVPNQNTALPVGLQTGSYYVVVSDAGGGCNDGTSNTVPITTTKPITFTTTPTDVTCYGSSTGIINLVFNGGSGSVTGSIYNGSTLLTSTSILSGSDDGNITATGLSSGSNYSVRLVDSRGCTISQSVTIGSPAAPFNADLNATGALYIYKPSLYDPYTAQFSLHGGNYSTYHVTLSAILPGNPGYIDVASGSFAGNSGTSSFTMPVSGACLYDSSSWILKATDALSCSLANSSSQATYVLPTQVITSLVQYVPTSSATLFGLGFATASCTASAVNLYFTASETSIGWSDMVIGDHVWENCNLTTSASGNGYWDFESVQIASGVYNPDDIHTLCSTIVTPQNRLYAQIVNTQQGSSQVTGLYSALSFNISTNSVVTASLASYTSYGNSNYYDYIQWTGSNTELWIDANLNNTSSYFAINSDVVMSVEPFVTLYYDFKSSGSTPQQIVDKNQFLFSIDYGCLTYQDSYLENLYDFYQLPLPVSLDPLYNYVLQVEYLITNAPNVCY